jgi:phage terminase large subunit-like protein
VVATGARGRRRYVLYVSRTQPQADDHVASIATMLESPLIGRAYPSLGSRGVGKYGSAKGWRRNRLWTASGFIVDALGLDTAGRGVKLGNLRPDFIVFDDIDEEGDSTEATQTKIDRITRSILPSGARNTVVAAVQNLIIENGVFGRMRPGAPEPAQYLTDRIMSGPVPALEGMETEEVTREDGSTRTVITAGKPTWEHQSLDACQHLMDTIGKDAFLSECQHEPFRAGEKIFKAEWWAAGRGRYAWDDVALLQRARGRFITFDSADSITDGAAYTVGMVFDLIPHAGNHVAVLRDVYRDRVETPELQTAITALARKWGFHLPAGRLGFRAIYVEYASSGRAAVQHLRRSSDAWIKPYLVAVTPRASKEDRWRQAAQYCYRNRVWIPASTEGAPWLGTFTDEVWNVPQAVYRDQADAWAQGILEASAWLAEPVHLDALQPTAAAAR